MTKSKGKAKAKWLQEGTDLELLTIVEDTLNGDLEQKEVNKAKKALEEVIDRLPEEEQELSVEEAIQALRELFEAGLENIANAYGAELEAIGEDEEELEDEDGEDSDNEDEDDEDEDEEEIDYSGMTLKELRAECRDRDIKGTKGLKKADLIALLEDSEEDEEDFEEDEDLDDEDMEDEEDSEDEEEELEAYEDMTLKDLRSECRERGIKVKKGMKKADFIEVLEADDED